MKMGKIYLTTEEAHDIKNDKKGKSLEYHSDGMKKVFLLENDSILVIYDFSESILYSSLKEFIKDYELPTRRVLKNVPRKRLFFDSNKRIRSYTVVGLTEAKDFIKSGNRIENLAYRLLILGRGSELYTNEGLLLVYNKQKKEFLLFDDSFDYEEFRSWYWEHHILWGLNPYGSNFLIRLDDLFEKIIRLCDELNIQKKRLDFSVDSLEVLDEIIFQTILDDEFYYEYYLSFLAYFGQTIATNSDYNWKMIYDKEYDLWEPMLIDSSDKTISIIVNVHNVLSASNTNSYESFLGEYIRISTSFLSENGNLSSEII